MVRRPEGPDAGAGIVALESLVGPSGMVFVLAGEVLQPELVLDRDEEPAVGRERGARLFEEAPPRIGSSLAGPRRVVPDADGGHDVERLLERHVVEVGADEGHVVEAGTPVAGDGEPAWRPLDGGDVTTGLGQVRVTAPQPHPISSTRRPQEIQRPEQAGAPPGTDGRGSASRECATRVRATPSIGRGTRARPGECSARSRRRRCRRTTRARPAGGAGRARDENLRERPMPSASRRRAIIPHASGRPPMTDS